MLTVSPAASPDTSDMEMVVDPAPAFADTKPLILGYPWFGINEPSVTRSTAAAGTNVPAVTSDSIRNMVAAVLTEGTSEETSIYAVEPTALLVRVTAVE